MYNCVCYKIFIYLKDIFLYTGDISCDIYLLLICDFNKLLNSVFVNSVRTNYFFHLYIFSEFLSTLVFTKNNSQDQPLNLSTYDDVEYMFHFLDVLFEHFSYLIFQI